MAGDCEMTNRTYLFIMFIILPLLVNSKQILHTSTVDDCYDTSQQPFVITMYRDDELTVMLPTGGPVANDDFRCEWQVKLLPNETDTNIYFPLMEFAGNIPNTDDSTTNQAQCTALDKDAEFICWGAMDDHCPTSMIWPCASIKTGISTGNEYHLDEPAVYFKQTAVEVCGDTCQRGDTIHVNLTSSGNDSIAFLKTSDWPTSFCTYYRVDSQCNYHITAPPGYFVQYLMLNSIVAQSQLKYQYTDILPHWDAYSSSNPTEGQNITNDEWDLTNTSEDSAPERIDLFAGCHPGQSDSLNPSSLTNLACLPRTTSGRHSVFTFMLPMVNSSNWIYPEMGAYMLVKAVKEAPPGTQNCYCDVNNTESIIMPSCMFAIYDKVYLKTATTTLFSLESPCSNMYCKHIFEAEHEDQVIMFNLHGDFNKAYVETKIIAQSVVDHDIHHLFNCTTGSCSSASTNKSWMSVSNRVLLQYHTGSASNLLHLSANQWYLETTSINSTTLSENCEEDVHDGEMNIVSGGGYFRYRTCRTVFSSREMNQNSTYSYCGGITKFYPTVLFIGECFDGVTVTLLDDDGVTLFEYNHTTCHLKHDVTVSGDIMTIIWERHNANITTVAQFRSEFRSHLVGGSSLCYILPFTTMMFTIVVVFVTLITISRQVKKYQRKTEAMVVRQQLQKAEERAYIRHVREIYMNYQRFYRLRWDA